MCTGSSQSSALIDIMDPHLQQFLLPNSATTNIDDSSVFPTCDSQSTAEEAKDKTLEGTTSGNKDPHISTIRSDDPERDIWDDSERMTLGSDAPQSVSNISQKQMFWKI